MRCEENQELLWAFGANELLSPEATLKRQAVVGHLASCDSCKETAVQLSEMRAAASNYTPQVDVDVLASLNQRLTPYIEAARQEPRQRWHAWTLLGGATAAVLATWLLVAVPSATTPAVPAMPTISHTTSPRVIEPTPFVRVAARTDSILRERVSDQRVSIAMMAGEAAFSFRGGGTRALSVSTAFGTVQVLGTRFSVLLSESGMRVQVAEGEVRVLGSLGVHAATAGQALWVTATGVSAVQVAPSVFLDDPDLFTHHATQEHAQEDVQPAALEPPSLPVTTPKAAAKPTAFDANAILAALDEGERLRVAGRSQEALAVYRQIATHTDAQVEPYRDLARYEMARLYGFALGDKTRAKAVLGLLTQRGSEEVHAQAALSLCELERDQPCVAAACLNALSQQSERRELAKEALGLLRAWNLLTAECP